MSLSATAKQEMVKEESAAVFVHLLTLNVEDTAVLHFCDNTENVTSNGITYYPCAFKIVLPSQTSDGAQNACQIQIDNIDRAISEQAIKARQKKMTCSVSIVMAQTPDVVERGPMKFIMRNININKKDVTAELYDLYIYDRKIPEGCYNPNDFPGLFS